MGSALCLLFLPCPYPPMTTPDLGRKKHTPFGIGVELSVLGASERMTTCKGVLLGGLLATVVSCHAGIIMGHPKKPYITSFL